MSMAMISRTSGNAGFTVLELAIALAIAGIALVTIFDLLSTAMMSARHADRLAEATILANSKLAEAEAMEPMTTGSNGGIAGNGLAWRVLVERSSQTTGSASGTPSRSLVSVIVSVGEQNADGLGNQRPLVQLHALAYAALR